MQVFYSRPRFIPAFMFKMLKSIGFQAVDMHFHSEYSLDAASSVRSSLVKCRQRGYGVAITDHNEIRGAVKSWKQRQHVFVIPGIEASTIEGTHTLYYFYDIGLCKQFYNDIIAPLKKNNPFFLPIAIDKLMDKAHRYNAVACVAHPYGVGNIGIKKIKIDGMRRVAKKFQLAEALNGSNLRKLNRKAIAWARHLDKGIVAGSDGHLTKELGNALTIAYGYDIESFLHSLIANRSALLGNEMNIFVNAIRQIEKEKKYFHDARKLGLGRLWVTDHVNELHKLEQKMSHSRHYIHKHARRVGLDKDAYSNYVKLRFGGF